MSTNNLQWPNDEIRHAGWSLLSQFQNDLFTEIEKVLKPLFGEDWFKQCLTEEKWKSKSPEKELYVLLKETVLHANQNFRIAIANSCKKSQSLTKMDLESLEKILNYRNQWSHEPSDNSKRISRADLRDLASNIKNFAISESLKSSCEYAIGTEELADLIFSLPVVARHLPINARNKVELSRISELIGKVNLNQPEGDSSKRESELVEGLTGALHGWQKTDLRLQLLLFHYRLLQIQLLSKVHVDANTLAAENFKGDYFEVFFSDVNDKFQIYDELGDTTQRIHKINSETVDDISGDIEELLSKIQEYSDVPESERCTCVYCKIVPTFLSPFEEKDIKRNDFIESEIFGDQTGIQFLHLLRTRALDD